MLDPGYPTVRADQEERGKVEIIKPCRAEAEGFLKVLDPNARRWTFQTFADDKNKDDGSLVRILHGSPDELWPELVRLNNKGAGIFVTINQTNLEGRSTKNILRVRALFAD